MGKLKRADEALTELVAPLWPGVELVAAWIEGAPRLFRVEGVPDREAYCYFATADEVATVIREASDEEARRFRGHFARASVILLADELAYPASFAERLQGITAPRPIHFAQGAPLTKLLARFDGLNLFHDPGAAGEASGPLAGLFSESSIFTAGELLDTPGKQAAGGEAESALREITAHPELITQYRLGAVLDSAGAALEDWSREGDRIRLRWRRGDEEYSALLARDAAPITSGICLPGARGIDVPALTRYLLDHALDPWRR